MPIAECPIEGKPLSIETGTLAKQAGGACVVRYGDTIVLGAATLSAAPREGVDFLPLTVDYEVRLYAAGRIPGSRFIKREGRPSERATVTCRLTDRPLRPLFPKTLRHEVQVINTVLSADPENAPDVLSIVAASAALSVSNAPFAGPVGAVRVGRADGRFVLNPTYEQREGSDLDVVVAGTREGVLMVEAAGNEVPEEVMAQAIEFGRDGYLPIIEIQEQLAAQVAKEKMAVSERLPDVELERALEPFTGTVREALLSPDKMSRENATREVVQEIVVQLAERLPERVLELPRAVDEFVRARYRALMLDEGLRPDGRRAPDIRPISCHVGLLPRAHGSGLFTRGQTQVLSALALGGMGEGQIIEDLPEEDTKRFMHHYNFPPYSVGEVRMLRGPSRRDIGHGMLAERALLPLLPDQETFPYTMRIVSEVLESNGSSSMASVCAATLALMDGGVPIRKPVAGIAMGMVSDETRHVILTDIQGIEDGYGDMDFKVAGTRDGITALQLDVKVGGLSHEVLTDALTQAREARLRILEVMAQTLAQPRPELAPHAPRMFVVEIHPDKIGDVIGPGGKVIKKIQADYEVRIDVEQDGRIYIAAPDQEAGEAAKKVIEDLTTDLQVGETYVGKVSRILPFGALVDLLPGKDGLIHISNLSRERVERVEDVVNVGDEVVVKVLEVDPSGKVRLTLNLAAEPGSGEGPHRGGPRRRR